MLIFGPWLLKIAINYLVHFGSRVQRFFVHCRARAGCGQQVGTSRPQIGAYCRLFLNSNIESGPKPNIVWGPYSINRQRGNPPWHLLHDTVFGSTDPRRTSGGSKYNSNSWAAGIFRSATGSVPAYDFSPYIAPGYQNPIPSVWYRNKIKE